MREIDLKKALKKKYITKYPGKQFYCFCEKLKALELVFWKTWKRERIFRSKVQELKKKERVYRSKIQ